MSTILDNVSLLGILTTLTNFLSDFPAPATVLNAVVGASTSADFEKPSPQCKGATFYLKTTGGTSTFLIQGKNPVTGLYYDIYLTAGVASGQAVINIYPGGVITEYALPQTFRVVTVTTAGGPTNYCVAEYNY